MPSTRRDFTPKMYFSKKKRLFPKKTKFFVVTQILSCLSSAMQDGIGTRDVPPANTLAGQVFARLQSDLKANRFKPGERLRFETMKSLYDVGVSPLREALNRLAQSGLVVQIGQKGFRVAAASMSDLRDVVEVRRFLEVRAFKEAILHGDDVWESAVVASFHRFSKVCRRMPVTPKELDVWEERHTDFHRALIAACPSRWLRQFWSVVFDQAERYRRLAIEVGHWPEDELEEHEKLMKAVLNRDVEGGGELLHAHIGASAQRLFVQVESVLAEKPAAKSRPTARRRRAKR